MEPTVSVVGETDKEPNKYVIKHQVVISAVESCRKVKSDGGVINSGQGRVPQRSWHFRVTCEGAD